MGASEMPYGLTLTANNIYWTDCKYFNWQWYHDQSHLWFSRYYLQFIVWFLPWNLIFSFWLQVTRRCGTCFNVKYRRHYAVQNLSPAKVSVFPTVWRYGEEYERTEASSMYFQIKSQPSANTTDMLQSSLTENTNGKGFNNNTFSTGILYLSLAV